MDSQSKYIMFSIGNKMQRFLIGTDGFIYITAVTFVIMLFYINTDIFQNSKLRMLSETHRRDVNGHYVTGDISKNYTTPFYTCTEIAMPALDKELKADYWQPVNKKINAFVFSAYFIHERKTIIISAMIRTVKSELFFCQFWYKGEDSKYSILYQTPAELIRLPEDHGHAYSAALFECSLQSRTDPPSYVSIVDEKCYSPLNILFTHHAKKPESFTRDFTVCLSPLHRKIDLYRFIEWLELNRILGADMFFVYITTNNINLNKVLDFYTRKGFMNIINWKLPEGRNQDKGPKRRLNVHYFGQVAALNDCLYRNKYESEYIVIIDLDEFIIPHIENETTWRQMLSHVNKTEVGYIARNTFFKLKGDDQDIKISNKTVVDKYKLITLQKLQREEKIFSAHKKSKYFSRTSHVRFVNIHGISGAYELPVNVGLLHHYRDLVIKHDTKSNIIIDRTVPINFGDVLIHNVITVWTELNGTLSGNV